MAARRILLKRGPNRSVLRANDAAFIVKRWHAQGLQSFGDRRRALREKRVLDRLRELDLPAPRTAEVRREADGAWVLAMECVGERTLATELAHSSGRLQRHAAHALGRLVAAFLAAGGVHADPHPANLVLDERDEPWIVDGRGIRFARVRRGSLAARLAGLAAPVRELLEPRTRARVFAELWRHLPHDLRGARRERLALLRDVETRARALRHAAVRANLDRWTRESGVCVASGAPSAMVVERRGARRDCERGGLLVVAGERALPAWRTAARLREHGLPVPPPHRIELGPRPRALFELDARARGLDEAVRTLAAEARTALAHRFGHVLGSFHDRGLRLVLARGGDLLLTVDGEPLVSPLARVDDLVRSASARLHDAELAPGLRELVAEGDARRALRDGYAQAFGEASERRAIRAELARG